MTSVASGSCEVPRNEVDQAGAKARQHGYDCANFRYSLFRPAHGQFDAALTGDFVVVSMVWPMIRAEMYRASSGAWIGEFERDLLNYRFERRRTARAS